jgi:hypothetical protein
MEIDKLNEKMDMLITQNIRHTDACKQQNDGIKELIKIFSLFLRCGFDKKEIK